MEKSRRRNSHSLLATEESVDPNTDVGGIFDIMAVTVIHTHLSAGVQRVAARQMRH